MNSNRLRRYPALNDGDILLQMATRNNYMPLLHNRSQRGIRPRILFAIVPQVSQVSRQSPSFDSKSRTSMQVNYGVQLAEVPGVPLNREQVTKFTMGDEIGRNAGSAGYLVLFEAVCEYVAPG